MRDLLNGAIIANVNVQSVGLEVSCLKCRVSYFNIPVWFVVHGLHVTRLQDAML